MRIVFLPLVGFRNLLGESDVLVYLNFARRCLEDGRKAFFYLVLPGGDASTVMPDLPNVAYLTEPFMEFMDQEMVVSMPLLKMFNPRVGEYPVDAVITSRSASAAWLARGLRDMRNGAFVPVFVNEPKVAEFGSTHQAVDRPELIVRLCGYASAYPVVLSLREKELLLQSARRLLAASLVTELGDRVLVHPPGLLVSQLEQIRRARKLRDRFTVFYGGRVNQQSKNAYAALNVMHRFSIVSNGVDAVVCSPRRLPWQKVDLRSSYPEFKFHEDVVRDRFLEMASQAHVFVSSSVQEGFTVGLCEMFMVGLVGVLPHRDWLYGMFGDDFGSLYPFVYRSEQEAVSMLLWIKENYEQAQKEADVVRRKIVELCGSAELGFLDDVETIVGGVHVPSPSESLRLLVASVLEKLPRVFSFDELWVCMSASAFAGGIQPGVRGNPSRWMVRRWLLDMGCEDLCNAPLPMFCKQGGS